MSRQQLIEPLPEFRVLQFCELRPLFCVASHWPSISACLEIPLPTYTLSVKTSTRVGRLRADSPSMTARSSMRLLVVSHSAPDGCQFLAGGRVNHRTPTPPGPGLPLQAPSV